MGGIASKGQLRMSFLRWAVVTVPLVLASASSKGPEAALEALALGAFDFVDKGRFRSMDFQLMGDEVVKTVRAGFSGSTGSAPASSVPAERVAVPRRAGCVTAGSCALVFCTPVFSMPVFSMPTFLTLAPRTLDRHQCRRRQASW